LVVSPEVVKEIEAIREISNRLAFATDNPTSIAYHEGRGDVATRVLSLLSGGAQ